jgi:hypothetical protein
LKPIAKDKSYADVASKTFALLQFSLLVFASGFLCPVWYLIIMCSHNMMCMSKDRAIAPGQINLSFSAGFPNTFTNR